MILIITNKEDVTADFVVLELTNRRKKFIRFNTEDFPEKVGVNVSYSKGELRGAFDFIKYGRLVKFSSIQSVWYRRPVLPRITRIHKEYEKFCVRESMTVLNGVWDSLKCFWVSHPRNIYFAENKLVQLGLAARLGFLTPETVVSNKYDVIKRFYDHCREEVIIKPVKIGLVDNDHVVFTNRLARSDLKFLKRASFLPSIYQKNIPKKFDIRITVIGSKVFATEIHSQDNIDSRIDWRKSQDIKLAHCQHKLPKTIENKCCLMVKRLGLRFGAIDMVLSKEGKYYFLEINPNGQWAWIERRTGYKLTEALTSMLIKREA